MIPAISILFLLSLPSPIGAGFDQIYNLMNPLVMEKADVLPILILRMGLMEARYELGTAMGLFNGMLAFVLVYVGNRLSRQRAGYSLW